MQAETVMPAALQQPLRWHNVGLTKSKTRTCKHIWVFIISSQLVNNCLVFTPDIAQNRCRKTNKSYDELKWKQCRVDLIVKRYHPKYNFVSL